MSGRIWTKRIAFFFLVLVFLLAGAAFWVSHTPDTAMSCPVQLTSGFSLTREFRVPAKAEYRIEIHYSRSSMPFEQLKKILQGGNCAKIDLLENGAPVQIRYLPEPIFRPCIVSTDEDGNLGFAEDFISQDIAEFTGDPKKVYTIACSVIRPIQELNSTRPILLVGLDPLEGLGLTVEFALLVGAALICGVLALIFGIVSLYLRHRAKRHLWRAAKT